MADHDEMSAEYLARFLDSELSSDSPGVPQVESSLASELRAMVLEIQTAPRFKENLQFQLLQCYQERPIPHQPNNLFRTLAWVTIIVLLVIGFTWTINNLLPKTITPVTQPPTELIQKSPTSTSTLANSLKPEVNPTILPPGSSQASPILPGSSLVMQAQFPENPDQVMLYEQKGSSEMTIDEAREIAGQLGIAGQVYLGYSEIPGTKSFIVTDGLARATITTPQRLYYLSNYPLSMIRNPDHPPVAEQVRVAEDFLKSRQMLDFPYWVETSEESPGLVRFIQHIDGRPILYNGADSSQVEVEIDTNGQVKSVNVNLTSYTEVGQYAIISAQEAWEIIISSPNRVAFSQITKPSLHGRTWQRDYPIGQRIELFGYLEQLQPAEAGYLPFLSINNIPIEGNIRASSQSFQSGQFMQVWGLLVRDSNQNLVLQVEGWQQSPFSDQVLQGTIERQGAKVYLLVGDRRYQIPQAPVDLLDGMEAEVRGVVVENDESILEWTWINSGYQMAVGSGGGGGGGGNFAELNLEGFSALPQTAMPTAYPTPAPGTRLDDLQGQVFIVIKKNSAGNISKEISLYAQPSLTFPDGLALRLEGSALQEIDRYHQQPIRVWGSIEESDSTLAMMEVERYEPVYPGTTAQAWLGSWEYTMLDGQQVIFFTAQDGNKYILETSIDIDPDSVAGSPGETIIIEGFHFPDRMFADYPVITDYSATVGPAVEDLADYQLQGAQPPVIEENIIQQESGKVIIDRIELVYYTEDMRFYLPGSDMPTVFIQPMWSFSGSFEDGIWCQFLVQALTEEFLR